MTRAAAQLVEFLTLAAKNRAAIAVGKDGRALLCRIIPIEPRQP